MLTERDILYRAVIKAEENGYKEHLKLLPPLVAKRPVGDLDEFIKTILLGHKERIIYSHEFAKAFWGEQPELIEENQVGDIISETPGWAFHLQEIVLEEKPIYYLQKFLR
jgi:hypothetical protein